MIEKPRDDEKTPEYDWREESQKLIDLRDRVVFKAQSLRTQSKKSIGPLDRKLRTSWNRIATTGQWLVELDQRGRVGSESSYKQLTEHPDVPEVNRKESKAAKKTGSLDFSTRPNAVKVPSGPKNDFQRGSQNGLKNGAYGVSHRVSYNGVHNKTLNRPGPIPTTRPPPPGVCPPPPPPTGPHALVNETSLHLSSSSSPSPAPTSKEQSPLPLPVSSGNIDSLPFQSLPQPVNSGHFDPQPLSPRDSQTNGS